uniref:Uncharacterized protein n=1 Tax=Avena sativa TaxID=4498 RepID=A0ACD5ZQI4_AVESA
MLPEPHNPVKVLEQCQVSPWPSPSSGKPRSLPLTFYDLAFWDVPPVQRLFFYGNADLLGAPEFLLSELPLFEKSLAATLHYFYPLAGKLPCGIREAAPEIVFSDGDSVCLTVAVGDDNFEDLAGDHARDTARLRGLLPPLLRNGGGGGSQRQCSQDVFAIQLTVFPLAGICIGTTLHHAVCDGSSYVHFMKTWAAIHRCGYGDGRRSTMAVEALPLFDRGVVRDNDGLREVFLSDHRAHAAAGDKRVDECDLAGGTTTELATFRFTDGLLRWLGRQVEPETSARRCSPYALACGAMWAGIVRARGRSVGFGFVTGCKPRASPPIPGNYFGNCLGLCRVEEEEGEMEAKQSCLLAAVTDSAAAIWRAIEGLAEEGRVFRDARGWVRLVREYASARAVTVAGSPKLGLYAATDLGTPWGRPRKVEIVSVERTGALALSESGRDGDGGIEVGLALPRGEMEAFRAFYADLLVAAA